jgi:secreted Zn-dependent insulinase-like peptidase
VGKRREWFPATVISYNSLKNQILCAYEDEDEKWHTLDIPNSDFPRTLHGSNDFEGTLDDKHIKYRIVSLAVEGSKPVLKFGDESDFHVDTGAAFPAVPPATPPSRLPRLTYDTAELKMWHMQDRTYKRPIADLRLQLYCAEANKTSLCAACADILVNLVSDSVTEISYMASVCELGSSFASDETGISMRCNGFHDKLLDLFRVMLEKLLRFRNHRTHDGSLPEGFSKDRFDLILESYTRALVNSGMKSQKLGSDTRIRCLRPGSFSSHQKHRALENLTISMFTATAASLLSKIGAVALYHGNVDVDDAKYAKDVILDLLRKSAPEGIDGLGGLPRKKYPAQFVLQLPPTQLEIISPSKDTAETNTAVEVYIQVGKDNIADRVMVDLLVEILYEPMYAQLRTKDQFGYDVSCASRWTHGVIGIVFCVVTPSKTAEETRARIDRFLLEYRETVESMDPKEFTEIMIGLANDKLNMFNSMPEETNHYWGEIRERRYQWEDHRLEVLHLKSITKEMTLKAYDEWLSPNNKKRKQLTVCVIAGEGEASAGRPDVKAEDVSEFNDAAVNAIHTACKNQTYGRIY